MADIIEKRRVVMRSVTAAAGGVVLTHSAEDYVPVTHLEAYLADARERWQVVEVPDPDAHDAGPGGEDGETAHDILHALKLKHEGN